MYSQNKINVAFLPISAGKLKGNVPNMIIRIRIQILFISTHVSYNNKCPHFPHYHIYKLPSLFVSHMYSSLIYFLTASFLLPASLVKML